MANPMRLMWYINPNDGPFPWSPNGQYLPDLNRSRELAVTLDQLGFYGALVVGRNPLVETASWVPLTRQMRFLIPIHPGATPPALLVQQAKLFDSISGGRLLMNQVNGTDQIMAHYGIDVPSNERYALSAEYWTLFKQLYAGEITGAHVGKYFKFAAPPMVRAPLASGGIFVQDPHTPVWGSGSSPDGIRHAGEVLDVYLTYLYRPDRLGPQLDEVRAAAAVHGRTPGFGLLCNIILRDTDEEAWAHAQWVLDQTGPAQIVRQIEARLKTGRYNPATGSREAAGFASLTSDDPQIRSRIEALQAGRVPELRSLEASPNIWSGPNSWGALDILDQGWGGYFVGSAQTIAARMRALQADLGIDAFILAGWPSKEESERVAARLMPLLDLDREPPRLRPV